jgi:hypothetical protein
MDYQEQSEEIIMLPSVLKLTYIKLQEETDLRVLAEETKNKLERAIKNVCIEYRLNYYTKMTTTYYFGQFFHDRYFQ